MDKKIIRRKFICAAVLFAALAVLSRLFSYLASVAYSDISYPEEIYLLFSVIAELFSAVRVLAGFSAVCHFCYKYSLRDALKMGALSLISAVFDAFLRLSVGLLSVSIYEGLGIALIMLALEFLCEAAFVAVTTALCFLMSMRYKKNEENSLLHEKKFGHRRADFYSMSLLLLSHVLLEVSSVVGFFKTYSDPTSAEIASMVWAFVKIFAIYGGMAYLVSRLTHKALGTAADGKEKTLLAKNTKK